MMFDPNALTLLLTLSLTAKATQSFKNTGTLSGWDFANQEHHGTVQQVTSIVHRGSTALKMTQTYDPNYHGRYHSEVFKNKAYKKGDTGFYGFAFRLQEDWQFSLRQGYNIAQFIADFSDLHSSCDVWMPSSLIWIEGNKLHSRVKYGKGICDQHVTAFSNIATVSAGVWHTVVIQANWKADETGFYKMWFDGEKVLERYGLRTTIDEGRYFQFHVGLYANGWHDDGRMAGSQGTRSVCYDDVGMGSTFADADPRQWEKGGVSRIIGMREDVEP